MLLSLCHFLRPSLQIGISQGDGRRAGEYDIGIHLPANEMMAEALISATSKTSNTDPGRNFLRLRSEQV